jgi:glycerate dehydrogenase
MKLHKAAFLDLASIYRDDLDLTVLKNAVPEWLWFDNISEAELIEVLTEVDVVVSNKVLLGKEQLQKAKHLKLICIAATGTNNVDLRIADELGISVRNVRAYATASVVQHVFTLLLSLTTHIGEYSQAVQRGEWSSSEYFCLLDYPIRELRGKTLGIVGYGELGKAVAKVASAFGMDVLIAKRNLDDGRSGRVPLGDLLKSVDVLSLHCPLNEDTRGLIGKDELALMKHDAVLINAARGGLVDEVALLEALENKKLGGAGIDVIEQEPPASESPLLQTNLPNLIVTPHIAWASVESRQRLIDAVAKNISQHIAALAAG